LAIYNFGQNNSSACVVFFCPIQTMLTFLRKLTNSWRVCEDEDFYSRRIKNGPIRRSIAKTNKYFYN